MVGTDLAVHAPSRIDLSGAAGRPVLLATLGVPLDLEAISDAARSTGRVVIAHEAPLTLGMGAELAARVMEEAFDYLEAPVIRVTGYDTPYPPASLESRWLPGVDRILDGARRAVGYR